MTSKPQYQVVLIDELQNETVLHTADDRESANNAQQHMVNEHFRDDFRIDSFTKNRKENGKMTWLRYSRNGNDNRVIYVRRVSSKPQIRICDCGARYDRRECRSCPHC